MWSSGPGWGQWQAAFSGDPHSQSLCSGGGGGTGRGPPAGMKPPPEPGQGAGVPVFSGHVSGAGAGGGPLLNPPRLGLSLGLSWGPEETH